MAGRKDNLPSIVCFHSNALVGDEVFIWGGLRPGVPQVHVSPEKRQFTSSVDVYNVLNGSHVVRSTTGTPHTGTFLYNCCSVGDDVYYFGGHCKQNGCYHNDLSVLNTSDNEWREIACDDGPTKKAGCGMIPFSSDGQEYLLVIGGHYSLPANTPAHTQYTPFPSASFKAFSGCCVQEIHIVCISSIPDKWTTPMISGSVFPPSTCFSIDAVPGSNTAIIFGGVLKDQKERDTNDVFILSYTKNSVDIQKITKPSDAHWPEPRAGHCSAIISGTLSNGQLKHYLFVLGGIQINRTNTDSCWVMDIENKTWKEIVLVIIAKRIWHSVTSFQMSTNCVWLLLTGGVKDSAGFINNPDILNLVELVFSPTDNQWTVNAVLNETDMKDKAAYADHVLDCQSVCRREFRRAASEIERVQVQSPAELELMKIQLMRKDAEIVRLRLVALSKLEEGAHQSQWIKEQTVAIERNEATIRKNQVALEQKETMIRGIGVALQQKEQMIRHRNDKIIHLVKGVSRLEIAQRQLQQQIREQQRRNETKDRENEVVLQQKEATIQQKQKTIDRKYTEIFDLRDQLESRPWIIEREELQITEERIGDGAYGEVKVAVFRGTRVAAKCLHEIIVSRHNRDIFTREMDISSKIHHPNIVQFLGATRVDNPILLYELMATSLYNRLQDDESLTRSQIAKICCDIALALCYLHQWRPDPIIHRDISSPNVLMEPLANNRWKAKVSDFGSANLQLHVKTGIPGNPAYAAPEADNPRHHSPAMDVYSFGILATEMILHSAPEMEMDSRRREDRANRIYWVAIKKIVLDCINEYRSLRVTSTQLLRELKQI